MKHIIKPTEIGQRIENRYRWASYAGPDGSKALIIVTEVSRVASRCEVHFEIEVNRETVDGFTSTQFLEAVEKYNSY